MVGRYVFAPLSAKILLRLLQKILPTPIGLLEKESNTVTKRQFELLSSDTGRQWYPAAQALTQLGKLDNYNLLAGLVKTMLEDLAALDLLEVM